MLDEEPQIQNRPAPAAPTNGNGASSPASGEKTVALNRALNAFYALNPDAKAEFLKIIVQENGAATEGHPFASSAAVFKDEPLWNDIKALMRTYREPEPEGQ